VFKASRHPILRILGKAGAYHDRGAYEEDPVCKKKFVPVNVRLG
jgi:hypothetical protein